MKDHWLWVIIIGICLVSCETTPDICLERTPIPVIYSVFNRYDTINYLYVTKTWSGDNGGTLGTAKNPDSIYFQGVSVRIDLLRPSGLPNPMNFDTVHVIPDFEWIHDKKPGLFAFPDCPLYALHYDLKDFSKLITLVNIPGYNEIKQVFDLLKRPEILFPAKDRMSISICPDKGLIVDFKGGSVNEATFFFEIITKTPYGLTSDTVSVKKYMSSGRTTFTYALLQSALNQQLHYSSNIEYSKLGTVDLEIWTGFGAFPMLPVRQEINSYNNDYTVPSSPKIPGLFYFGGSIGTNRVRKLNLDYQTCEAIANDTVLKRFRFLRW